MSNRKNRRANMRDFNRGVNAPQAVEAPVWITNISKKMNNRIEADTEFKIARNYTKGKARRIAVSFYGNATRHCLGKNYVIISKPSECGERFYVKPCETRDNANGAYKLSASGTIRRYTQLTLDDKDLAVINEWVGEYKKLHYERAFDAYYVLKSERIPTEEN